GDGREGRGQHPDAAGSARHDGGGGHAHRRQREREDRRGHGRLSRAQPTNKAMQATRKAAIRFKERSELLDFLLEVSSAISLTLDLDQLLANVAEIVQRVLPYDLFAILLYSERRQDLRIRYGAGHREEVIRNLSVALGEGITGAAAASREPVLVDD